MKQALRFPRPPLALLVAAIAGVGASDAASAQELAAPDSVHLRELQAAASAHDARAEQIDLLVSQTQLRLRSLALEGLPSFRLHGQGQYQSDVASIPFELPGGQKPPRPPNDTYDAHLALRQSLYDPSRRPRRALEEARLAESHAGVRASLYDLRRRVNEAFFAVLLLGAQAAEVDAALAGLRAQLTLVEARVAEGAALPSEAATLQREVLRRLQMADGLRSQEDASRAVLAALSGRAIPESVPLAMPSLAAAVAAARQSLAGFAGRPEMERFERGREVLEQRADVIAARERPQVSAFGRSGYGRPGLNPLASEFDSYWLGGVQVEWTPWSWGATDNERQELALQREILRSEEEALADEIRRGAISELATIDRLGEAIERDLQIIDLSDDILAETRVRFGEGVVTSAELVEREAELLQARLDLVQHRIELAHARARFLTLTGRELP